MPDRYFFYNGWNILADLQFLRDSEVKSIDAVIPFKNQPDTKRRPRELFRFTLGGHRPYDFRVLLKQLPSSIDHI